MANKLIPPEKIRKKDIIGEVKFDILATGINTLPIRCHGKKSVLVKKTMKLKGIPLTYEVWQCPVCKEEYLDSKQSKFMESVWRVEKLLKERSISVKRRMNHDGKSYFVRFPAVFSKNWKKGMNVNIDMLSEEEFLVKIIDS